MICAYCDGHVTWRGPLSDLTHTQCVSCGRRNCQVVEEPEDQGNDEEGGGQ